MVGDYSFQFLVEELAVAAQYDVGFVLIMLNNEYLGLIRQAETGYDMNFEVDIHYDANGTDNVKIMEAYGCSGTRVHEPGGDPDVAGVGPQGGRAHQPPGPGGDHDRTRGQRRHGRRPRRRPRVRALLTLVSA